MRILQNPSITVKDTGVLLSKRIKDKWIVFIVANDIREDAFAIERQYNNELGLVKDQFFIPFELRDVC